MYRLKILMILLIALFLVGCDKTADTGETMSVDVFRGHYDSYEELEMALTSADGEAVIAAENVALYGENYKQFVEDMLQGELVVVKPYMNDEIIPLQEMSGSGISLMSSESFGKTWIFYKVNIEGKRSVIRIAYLEDDEIEYAKDHSHLELITYLNPERGKALKRWWWDFSIKNFEETTIQLYDRTVKATCLESREDKDVIVEFVYDNMYVYCLIVDTENFNDDTWSHFHLK